MRLWLLAACLSAVPLSASPAQTGRDLVPRCGGPFQLCGYVDKTSHALRIGPRFEVAHPFSEGLAAVRIDGRYGYIDATGTVVVAARFEAAGAFAGGYAEVRLGGASGIIDRSGFMVVPARFKRIIPFTDDTFIAEPLRRAQRPSQTTEVRLEGFEGLSPFVSLDGAGLYRIRRGWLTNQDLEFSEFDARERGLIWAANRNRNHQQQWGLLRADGTWQVSPRFNHVQRLMDTHAVVTSVPDYSLPPRDRRDAIRWGAVDRNGKLVVPLKFAHLSYWRGGYGYTKEGKPFAADGPANEVREGIVRADGTLLGDRYFDAVDIPESARLPRGRLDGTWYSIEPDGRLIPDQLDGTLLAECPSGLRLIRRGEQVEFRRPGDGKTVGRFDEGHATRGCPEVFSVKRDGRWYFVLQDGSVLGGARGFETTYSFSGEHAPVRVEGKWGIIDRSGSFTVAPRFATLRPGGGGRFVVGEGEEAYWIDAQGERVEEPAVRKAEREQALTCPGGLRLFQRAGLWGLRDGDGKTVIEPRFRALSCFSQGVSWTAAPGARRWCAIGPDGERRVALECGETFYPVILTHHHPEPFADDAYESSVLWNRAWLDYAAGNRETPPRWISDGGNGGSYTVMPGRVSVNTLRAWTDFELLGSVILPAFAGAGLLLVAIAAFRRRRRGSGEAARS